MDVLVCLATHAETVVSRDQLMEAVWPDVIIVDDTLTRCISQLRKTFGETPTAPRFIQTIRKRGYQLCVPVTPPPPARPAQPRAPRQPRRARRQAWGIALSLVLVGLLGWHLGRQQPALHPLDAAENAFTLFIDSTGTPHPLPDNAFLPADTAFVWHGTRMR